MKDLATAAVITAVITVVSFVLFGCLSSAGAESITIDYVASIDTVVGSPFGLDDSVAGETVTGSFTYETSSADVNPATDRGWYPHGSGGAFSAELPSSLLVTGSTTPYVEIENFRSDTFRYIDGPRDVGHQGGVMAVGGTDDGNVELRIALTDNAGAVISDDQLPETFPFDHTLTHTFTLTDGTLGTLELQFSELSQVPEPSSALLAVVSLLGLGLMAWRRRPRCS